MASEAGAPRTVVILGAAGQVGRALVGAFGAAAGLARRGGRDVPTWRVVALDRRALDVTDADAVRATLGALAPAAIVNATGYTAVDRAESEPDLAHAVNVAAPAVLAEVAESLGAALVHYSSDYVFDGTKGVPYVEDDTPAPLSVYGATKLEGERAVSAGCPRHLVFRTSWVFSDHGTNFPRTMLRLAAEREALRVVADQRGAPTSAALIARVTVSVLDTMIEAAPDDPCWGLYHLTAQGEVTWHAYARRVIEAGHRAGLALRCASDAVVPVPTAEYAVAARRPADSRLDTARLRGTFGVTLPPWEADVDAAVARLIEGAR